MTKTTLSKLLISVVVSLLGFVLITGCSGDSANAEKSTYTIKVTSEGGMPLSEVSIRVYKDTTQEQLIWAAETDDKGGISFEAEKSESYVAVLEDVPAGYQVKDSYQIKTTDVNIQLDINLLDANDLQDITYKLGDVYHDFTVTSVDGTEYKLSELLEKKKAVILNFWYLNCGPCKMEFPYLQEAYEEYKEVIEVIAINPYDGTNDSIVAFANERGLSFPMVKGESEWQSCMNLTSYPTTVVIDQYGTIAMIHKGSITNKEEFTKIFEYFTSDDYTQTTIRNLDDIE